MSMAGARNANEAFTKDMTKKEDMDETDCISDDIWLKKWSCEAVKEEEILNNCGGDVKLSAIKTENCDNGSACEGEKDKKLENGKEERSTVSKGRERVHIIKKVSRKIDALIKKLCQDAPISEDVSSLCQFQCKECGKLATSWRGLKNHYCKFPERKR